MHLPTFIYITSEQQIIQNVRGIRYTHMCDKTHLSCNLNTDGFPSWTQCQYDESHNRFNFTVNLKYLRKSISNNYISTDHTSLPSLSSPVSPGYHQAAAPPPPPASARPAWSLLLSAAGPCAGPGSDACGPQSTPAECPWCGPCSSGSELPHCCWPKKKKIINK